MSDTVVGQQDPGTLGSEYNVWAFVIGQLISQVQTVTLVKIISCSNDGGLSPVGRVVVQPLVFQVSSLKIQPHGEIHDVPYVRLQGGADAVILDPKPNDIGIALFASRDIANIKADPQGAVAAGGATPGSKAQFNWADGLYIGGVLNGNPTQYIRFSADGIEIVSPTKITLRAPTVEVDASTLFMVQTGAIDAEATGDAKMAGATAELQASGAATVSGATVALEATGAATVQGATITLAGPIGQTGGGNASFSGSVEAPTGDVTASGTSLHNHDHGPGTYVAGSTPVTGNSSPP